ncbi:MAG: hypothetical protein NVS3B14_13060 [Ktedonobacteraceae bacterium]
MTIDTDFHSHVARSSTLQMARSARDKGLRVLGLSEHIFQMTEARPTLQHIPGEGPLLSFAAYGDAVRSSAQEAHIQPGQPSGAYAHRKCLSPAYLPRRA